MFQAPPPAVAPVLAPAAAPPPACDQTSQVALQAALDALKSRDPGTAKGLLDGEIPKCPAANPLGRALRTLRGELAVGDGDFAGARAAIAPVSRPQGPLGATASFIALAADFGLKDDPAFAKERADLLAGVDGALTAAGKRLERFQAGGATVSAYDAPVTQGAFVRRLEFVIESPGRLAYPRVIALTDDTTVDKVAAEQKQTTQTWFVDVYTCTRHVTIKQLQAPAGAPPAYADVKALVSAYLADPASAADVAGPLDGKGVCPTHTWLAPGLS